MANPGTTTSYDLNIGSKLDVEDVIYLISPFDVPLQGAMGADSRTALAEGTCYEKKVEWLDEVLLTPRSTLASQVTSTTATVIYLATGTGINFQTGDVLYIDGETLNVTGYGTTTDTLVVTRGFGSTTPTTFATADVVIGVGSALAEGSDPPAARVVDRADRFNYTQVFGPVAVTVSGSEQAIQKYGLVGTEFDHQVANRLKEMFIGIESALIYGVPYVGTASVGRTMGGMLNYISTNVDASTTSISDSAILTQAQACFDAGGYPDRLLVGSKQKRLISGLDSTLIRYDQTTNVRGQVVDFYDSDYGRVSVILDRWMKVNNAILFERDQASIETFRPLQFEMLAKTGDSEKGQVVGEKTMRFRMQSHSAAFTTLT